MDTIEKRTPTVVGTLYYERVWVGGGWGGRTIRYGLLKHLCIVMVGN